MPGQTLTFAMFFGSLVTASNASSAEYGTVEQATTMLDGAVVEMKADADVPCRHVLLESKSV